MNPWMDCYAPLIGRILMGGYFLWSAISLALTFSEPLSALVVAIEALGGIALVVGYRTRSAALVLAVLVVTLGYLYTDFNDGEAVTLFITHMGLVGGLLYISAYGAGKWRMPSYK